MLVFLYGEDWFRLLERKHSLTADFEKKNPASTRTIFDMSEEENSVMFQSIREILSGGLFATPTILFLEAPLSLGETMEEKVKEVLLPGINNPEALVLISMVGKIKKTGKLVVWLLKKSESEPFDFLDALSLEQYGRELLKKIDPLAKIEASALKQLALNCQSDTGRLFQELTKLSLYCQNETITSQAVAIFSSEPLESRVFGAMDAIVEGRRDRAVALLRLEEKMFVPHLKTLGLCAWQLRRLLEAKDLYEGGVRDASSIARELKTSPYGIQKLLPHLSKFTFARLTNGLALLADFDLAIKKGALQPGVALDLFVWKF